MTPHTNHKQSDLRRINSKSVPTHKITSKVILGGEVSKEISISEEMVDIFTEMDLNKKMSKQTKESLFSQIHHEELSPPRLLSIIYFEKGTLHMVILQHKVYNIEKDIKSHKYETTRVTIDLEKILLEDKIEWHKKTSNMVSKDLIQAIINVRRLNIKVKILENQSNIEKITNRARQISISDLEKKLIALRYDPSDKYWI